MPRAAKKTPVKKTVAKKPAPVKKPASAKKAVARRAGGAPKTERAAARKTVAKKAVVRRAGGAPKPERAAPAKKAVVKKAVAKKAVAKKAAAPFKKVPAKPPVAAKKKVVLDKFMLEQRDLLYEERARHVEQAQELRAEADQIAADMEPGDVQFDEESGEGTTTAIDRERDLALSMQAQVEVEEIDHALTKLQAGTYGLCEHCGQPIPRPRLRAIPHARLCIACKSGGLSRR